MSSIRLLTLMKTRALALLNENDLQRQQRIGQAAVETYQDLFQAQALATESLEGIRLAQETVNQRLINTGASVDEQTEAWTRFEIQIAKTTAQSLEFSTTAVDGFRRGFQNIKADILDVSREAEQTLSNAFNSAQDALVEFVQTGEFNFSKLIDSILADLTRLLAQQALKSLITGLAGGGGGGGGIFASLLGAFGGARANGGPGQSKSIVFGWRTWSGVVYSPKPWQHHVQRELASRHDGAATSQRQCGQRSGSERSSVCDRKRNC